MNPIASLVADIESALGDDSGERRIALLRKITGLFIEQEPDLHDDHISVFDEVILCLALEIEIAARIELSETLADIGRGPRRTISNLALDDRFEVAKPVLERSACIEDNDLAEVARTRTSEFLVALANREHLPATVTDILLERGDDHVLRQIAENNRQTLSNEGLRILAEKAAADSTLYRILRGRPDLALRHIGAIIEAAKQRARSEMSDLADEPGTLEHALESGAAQALINPSIFDMMRPGEDVEPNRVVWPVWPTDITRITAQIERGQISEALAGIASLANVPRPTVERAYHSPHNDPILFILRAIDCDWSSVLAILTARQGKPLLHDDLTRAHAGFHALSTATAKRVMQFVARQPVSTPVKPLAQTRSNVR
jgi:uncharacterized protein (DUF2336 family)